MDRPAFDFGRGSFVGTIMRNPDAFFETDIRDQARILGWVAGCPVVEELTDPSNPDPSRGPEAMLKRYGQISFWFGYAMETIRHENPVLFDRMTSEVNRLEEETVGKHEPESIPEEYKTKMQPMTTLVGFITPRLLIEQIGIGKSLSGDESSQRMHVANEALRHAAATSFTEEGFLALFANNIRNYGSVPDEKIKKLMDPSGWLEEHNALSMVERLRAKTAVLTPDLHEAIYQ